MKRKIVLATAIILLLISLLLFLYPEISKSVAKGEAIRLAEDFDNSVKHIIPGASKKTKVEQIDTESTTQSPSDNTHDIESEKYNFPVLYQEDIDRLLRDSRGYNESIILTQSLASDFSISALDLTNYGIRNGIFGYISIPTLDLVLPIYLGSSGYNMAYGVTHLMGTSLPIGGESTNAVIAGHTGYIGKEFFDALPALTPGDSVFITNFWGTCEYEVVFSKVIGPTEANDLYIQEGKDLLSLLTCADYGTKRYLVQCERKKEI